MVEKARWMNVVGDKPKARDTKEIFEDPESAMQFAAVAEDTLNSLVPPVGPSSPARIAERATLASALAKIRSFTHRPESERGVPIDLTAEERAALVPVYDRYGRGNEAKAAVEGYFKNEEIMSVLEWASKQPGNSQLTGLLAMPGSRANDFYPQALKTLAHINPTQFRQVTNELAKARNFAQSDTKVLTSVREFGAKFGFDERTMLETLSRDTWEADLTNLINPRLQGRSDLSNWWNEFKVSQSIRWLRGGVEKYREHDTQRTAILTAVSATMTGIVTTPGVVASALEQVAFKPKAAPESKESFEKLQTAKTEVTNTMNDPRALEQSLQSFGTGSRVNAADWRNRRDQATSDRLARAWLDNEYQSRLEAGGATGGGFWEGVIAFLASLSGVAYGNREVDQVASKIRGLP